MTPFLSIVAPAYNEEQGIEAFIAAVQAALRALPQLQDKTWEIVIVDDGSRDHTAERVQAAAARGYPVTLIQLSRNFGHQAAMTAGIDAARGELVITMDADLQHPPRYFAAMLDAVYAGADVVLMQKKSSHQRQAYKSLLARAFYLLMTRISDASSIPDVGDFRLMTREVADVLRECRETHRFLRGLVSWAGFRQTVLEYEVDRRALGESKYTLRKLWQLASTGLFSHSSLPLKWPFFLGVPLFGGSVLYLLWGLVEKLVDPSGPPRGWLSFLGFEVLFSGLIFVALGIQGAYIAKIFEQSKQRPMYVVRRARMLHSDEAYHITPPLTRPQPEPPQLPVPQKRS